MKIVATHQLKQALMMYPMANEYLGGWHKIISSTFFESTNHLARTFTIVKQQGNVFMFKLPGSSLVVNTKINFEAQVVLMTSVVPTNG